MKAGLRRAAGLWLLAMLIGCANPDSDWEIAQRDDTPEGYLEFMAKHPDSEYVGRARSRVDELKVVRAWERAEFRDTEAGYQDFIDRFPDSESVALANERLAAIERDAAWSLAEQANSIDVVSAFLRDYPEAPQRAEAEALLADLNANAEPATPVEPEGDFRLQLAAFRTAEAASTELRRLVALFPDTIGGPVRIEGPTPERTTKLFVLKTLPMSEDDAKSRCEALHRYGQTCQIIPR